MCLRPRRSVGRGRRPRAQTCLSAQPAGQSAALWGTARIACCRRGTEIELAHQNTPGQRSQRPNHHYLSCMRRPRLCPPPGDVPRILFLYPGHRRLPTVLLSSICSHVRPTNTTGLRPGRARCADVGAASAATRRAVAAAVGAMAALVPNAAAVAVAARRSAAMRCRALWCARGRRAASTAGRASARRPLGAAGALSAAVADGAARAAADADVHTFTVGESAKQKVRDRACLFRHRACRLVRAIHQPRARNPRERVFAREREPRARRSAADAVAAFKLALLTAMRLYIPAVARPPGLYASFARRGPPVRSRRSCASTPFCPRRCPM